MNIAPSWNATLRGFRVGGGSLTGIHVGEKAVVSAGAVVTKDVSENSLVMGIPARFVRSILSDAAGGD